MVTIHCFFSGGRDSALACYIAHRVARVKGWEFRLIHINTTIYLKETHDYVYEYARWLGVDLIELKPNVTYEDLAVKYGYPSLFRNRWCYHQLKRTPTLNYLRQNYKPGDLMVLGVRGSESLFRLLRYDKVFTNRCFGKSFCVNAWYPILHLTDVEVNQLIRKFNIPVNPVWVKVGISGECLCLAGTTEQTLIKLFRNYPDVAKWFVDLDKRIQANRRKKEPSYPLALYRKKITLSEWYERLLRQSQIDDFITNYQSCPYSCMVNDFA